ncbi:MAG: DUF5667 domain-containing protein [bacterium]|nr:DUF5667 domain-containing protein [bacterium]
MTTLVDNMLLMRKKFNVWETLLVLSFLVFGLSILGITFFQTTVRASDKLTKTLSDTKITPSPAVTPTPSEVDYFLPYPGILPDNILYSVKMARDKVMLMFTFDPLKKADLMLLFADKRLGAGRALVEGGKTNLGIETLTKGEKYLEQASNQGLQAGKEGKNAGPFFEKLAKASLKHGETLKQVAEKSTGEVRSDIYTLQKYSQTAYETAVAQTINR